MNDTTLRELRTIVERAVRPVRATSSGKRHMREELLAHVTEVFERERAEAADEQLALERTAQRFGDPQALSSELQQNVPRPLQWLGRYQSWVAYRPRESALRFASRQTFLVLVGYLVFIVGWLPVALIKVARIPASISFNILLDAALVMVLFTFFFILFCVLIAQAMYGETTQRSRRLAWGYLIASLALFPTLAFMAYWLLVHDLAASLAQARFGCYFAPLAPICFWLLARQMADEIREAQDWASLEIDG